MPKHDFFSPKAIANRIKAKGLQKLKWYCQMCQKQCRDENGFKCHKMSESHRRQMMLFIDNSGKFMNQFSREFEQGFMQILKLKGGRRVKANECYQDYISDSHHFHMNATIWSTLTGFVLYLGRTGKATVERAEHEGNGKGWYITYIDRDPEVIEKQEKVEAMKKMEERERKREENKIKKLIAYNQKMNKIHGNDYKPSELIQTENDSKLTFGFKPKPKIIDDDALNEEEHPSDIDNNDLKNDGKTETESNKNGRKKRRFHDLKEDSNNDKGHSYKKRKTNAYEEIVSGTWMMRGIIVKIKKKGVFKGKKAEILDVSMENGIIHASLKVLKCKECDDNVCKMKEMYLETVIPSFGRNVKILSGKYKSSVGVLKSLYETKYCGNIELISSRNNHKRIVSIPYEHFSKYVVH